MLVGRKFVSDIVAVRYVRKQHHIVGLYTPICSLVS